MRRTWYLPRVSAAAASPCAPPSVVHACPLSITLDASLATVWSPVPTSTRPSCWCTGTWLAVRPVLVAATRRRRRRRTRATASARARGRRPRSSSESSPASSAPAATPIASSDSPIAPPDDEERPPHGSIPEFAAIGARPLSGSDCSDIVAPCELASVAIGGATSRPRLGRRRDHEADGDRRRGRDAAR